MAGDVMVNTKSIRYVVTGRVQGVGFRAFTKDTALALGLNGWVRNLSDGSVEIMASGPTDKIHTFEEKIRVGPSFARVVHIVTEENPAGHNHIQKGFHIERTASHSS